MAILGNLNTSQPTSFASKNPADGPKPPWQEKLSTRLQNLKDKHQWRQLIPIESQGAMLRTVDGKDLLNLGSNDYLGLAQHPALKQAAIDAVNQYGTGSTASRLVCGTREIHRLAEQEFAAFKHAEAAILFPTGYMANWAVLTSLPEAGDLICLDKLSHASLIDASRASEATTRVFPHLHYPKLERLLAGYREENPQGQAFIVSDSIFSMDGDCADLVTLGKIAKEYDAILVIDEAHATGLLGETGSGLCELQKVSGPQVIVISTASKALGCLGGMVTGSQTIIDGIINFGRPFIYTTAVPPMQSACLRAAIRVVREEPQRREHVLSLSKQFHEALTKMGLARNQSMEKQRPLTPIFPIITGSSESAVELACHLAEGGFFAPAIRPPTVAPNSARVRISLRADIKGQELDQLIYRLQNWTGWKR